MSLSVKCAFSSSDKDHTHTSMSWKILRYNRFILIIIRLSIIWGHWDLNAFGWFNRSTSFRKATNNSEKKIRFWLASNERQRNEQKIWQFYHQSLFNFLQINLYICHLPLLYIVHIYLSKTEWNLYLKWFCIFLKYFSPFDSLKLHFPLCFRSLNRLFPPWASLKENSIQKR